MAVLLMSVTKRSIILALLFLILAVGIYVYSTMVGKKVVSDVSQLPTFIATDTEGAVYDKNIFGGRGQTCGSGSVRETVPGAAGASKREN